MYISFLNRLISIRLTVTQTIFLISQSEPYFVNSGILKGMVDIQLQKLLLFTLA